MDVCKLTFILLINPLPRITTQITRWEWARQDSSPAAGDVVGNTWREPVLYLVNAVPGQYTFQLRVWDDQGKSGKDAVTITVKKNPEERNIIRAVFNQVRL